MALVGYVVGQLKSALPPGMTMEDALQEGFVGLIDAARNYHDDIGQFSTYACLRIRGAVLDAADNYQWFYKRRSRQPEEGERLFLEYVSEGMYEYLLLRKREEHASMILEKLEEKQEISDSVAKLRPLEREIIIRHYYEDIPLSKISRMSGIEYTQVRRIHEYALRKLREFFRVRSGGNSKNSFT